LVEAARSEAARLLAERDAASREDLDSFIMAVHAMKAPSAAVSLLADRAERTGEALRPIDLKLEAEELDRLLELALGRIRLGDFERDSMIERIDLRELISSSVRRARRIFIARGISVALSEKETFAETDRKWMLFILDQLVVNAAKYAKSSVHIVATCTADVATVSIDDDGPGIPAEEQGRLFARSFVGTTGRRADGGGTPATGYGLHLASRAAEKLGARIALDSAPGGGTRAVVSIQIARDRFS
jgi:signal transduction histidine kinase